MKLSLKILKKMVQSIANTRPDEIDCEECFEQVDQFAELQLQGKNAAEAMPLVQDHLDRCGACREEFEALLDCLRATAE
jgi:predicted anti-sigma-YlaC factor YlaD